MSDDVEYLSTARAADVLLTSDRDSVGVVRILSDDAGTPGSEREYVAGDEVLVERGQAEWVVAPVHLPSAGRRLDFDAESEATPADGFETYPPAEPTSPARRGQARVEGGVDANTDPGLGVKMAKARAEADQSGNGDAKLQATLGGRGARSGPVTAQSDLPADQPTEAETATDSGTTKAPAKKAASSR